MKKTSTILFLLLFAISCSRHEYQKFIPHDYSDVDSIHTDYLVSYSDDSIFAAGTPCGYKDTNGKIIIPRGKYESCWTDTFRNYAIVWDSASTFSLIVAIDRKERILFDIYLFDNWPDEPSEGLFRVKRNEKVGFANELGQVVIPCQYQCAFPFENGIARVAYKCTEYEGDCEHKAPESEEWFFIDKNGKKVK